MTWCYLVTLGQKLELPLLAGLQLNTVVIGRLQLEGNQRL